MTRDECASTPEGHDYKPMDASRPVVPHPSGDAPWAKQELCSRCGTYRLTAYQDKDGTKPAVPRH